MAADLSVKFPFTPIKNKQQFCDGVYFDKLRIKIHPITKSLFISEWSKWELKAQISRHNAHTFIDIFTIIDIIKILFSARSLKFIPTKAKG